MPLLRTALVGLVLVLLLAPAALRLGQSTENGSRQHLRELFSRARDILRLVLAGHPARGWSAISYRTYSDSTSLGLRRDLSIPFTAPTAKIPFSVRPLAPTDDLTALDLNQAGLSADEAFWRLTQSRLVRSGLQTCYVAITDDGKVCFMQWVILPRENGRLQQHYGNLYPTLESSDALLEGAYTPEAYRGLGIMSAAMARIAERAAEGGARWVLTFVDESNVASVKGCLRAGFAPYLKRHESFRLFQRRVNFDPISDV